MCICSSRRCVFVIIFHIIHRLMAFIMVWWSQYQARVRNQSCGLNHPAFNGWLALSWQTLATGQTLVSAHGYVYFYKHTSLNKGGGFHSQLELSRFHMWLTTSIENRNHLKPRNYTTVQDHQPFQHKYQDALCVEKHAVLRHTTMSWF